MARGETRKAILDVAENLLQRLGYNAFSYQHISDQLGIKKAAIHYHFASKGDLGVALIQRYRARFSQMIADGETQYPHPWQRLKVYLEVRLDYLLSDGKICPGGILGAEFQSLPAAMQQETQYMLQETNAWLAHLLEEGRRLGQFSFAGKPADKALLIGATLQGALQIARATNVDSIHRIVEQLTSELFNTESLRPLENTLIDNGRAESFANMSFKLAATR